MRIDPTDTGGLFVGRRPGTAPVRSRIPQRVSHARRGITGSAAGVLVAAMIALSLLCWGPIPLACLWVGSEIDYVSGSVFLGIVAGLIALFPPLLGVLSTLRQIDHAWILVRRAGGHDQRTGVMARIFGTTASVCALAFVVWFFVIQGPGSQIVPGRGGL